MSSTQQLLLGEGAGGAAPNYIEEVFSTYLYTGTGASLTITNGIDLSTKGGLVWVKNRSTDSSQSWTDTARGATKLLRSNFTAAQADDPNGLTAFSTTGFTVGSDAGWNASGNNIVSWTFRKQPKFFDVVTFVANGSNNQRVSHNLGSVPSCIIIKNISRTEQWNVYHTSLGINYNLSLNTTGAAVNVANVWGSSSPTTTDFGVNGAQLVTQDDTYVAYIYAHNAGGFGLTGTDNVISCGSFTTDGSGSATVSLGYEPQYILMKRTNGVQNWFVFDIMRGLSYGDAVGLSPNITDPDSSFSANTFFPTATGFSVNASLSASSPYIYIAIRRGPMKVPTDATKVFAPLANTTTTQTTNFTTDAAIVRQRDGANGWYWGTRLVGFPYLESVSGSAEFTTPTDAFTWQSNTQYTQNLYAGGSSNINYAFDRAPGFMDVVCYIGTGVARTVAHNLAAVPELMIVKDRSQSASWRVYSANLGATKNIILNLDSAATSSTLFWNDTAPTLSVFTVGTGGSTNFNGSNFVAYLFATCAGVSKVGTYTGTGGLQTVNCGFTSGARFVLIKRTDSTGDWWTYDSARGITSGNDPYLFINSSAAEVTSTNYVDTDTTGFKVTAAAPAGLNASGGTYIFLAIA
jgi:hypothetical protein